MELVFIRHGQGEHTLDIPSSLQIEDPSLTNKGVEQAKLLRNQIPLTNKDIIIISPIRRTLETALIWSENIDCRKIVSPLVSPRMFPIRPEWETFPCDRIIDLEIIKNVYPTFEIDSKVPLNIWSDGINTFPENQFIKLAEEFIVNCKQLQKEKIYIVSHDGTITSYRQMISGQSLTRKDFLLETDWFQITC
ncbi:histidine phosphatase family protein [Peribacillus sp. FSL E2-0218]|uniref:phosphoglycerate mutase family protein n=1 Tax=Peribacillus sp. FSL E2-0218 TaxID=2921364 RepID=UPI0030EC962F